MRDTSCIPKPKPNCGLDDSGPRKCQRLGRVLTSTCLSFAGSPWPHDAPPQRVNVLPERLVVFNQFCLGDKRDRDEKLSFARGKIKKSSQIESTRVSGLEGARTKNHIFYPTGKLTWQWKRSFWFLNRKHTFTRVHLQLSLRQVVAEKLFEESLYETTIECGTSSHLDLLGNGVKKTRGAREPKSKPLVEKNKCVRFESLLTSLVPRLQRLHIFFHIFFSQGS